MAVNESRVLAYDFDEGLTDGVVKKDAPDRGGVVEPDAHNRSTLAEWLYDYSISGSKNRDMARRLRGL